MIHIIVKIILALFVVSWWWPTQEEFKDAVYTETHDIIFDVLRAALTVVVAFLIIFL